MISINIIYSCKCIIYDDPHELNVIVPGKSNLNKNLSSKLSGKEVSPVIVSPQFKKDNDVHVTLNV